MSVGIAKRARAFSFSLAVLTLAWYWGALLVHGQQTERMLELESQIPSIFLVNGLQVSFETALKSFGPEPWSRSWRGRSLVLISSDSCTFSRRIVPAWEELLAGLESAASWSLLASAGA
jgi:hypothetical protein